MVRDNSVLKRVLEKKIKTKDIRSTILYFQLGQGTAFQEGRAPWWAGEGVLHPIFSMAGIDEEEKGSAAFGYKVPKLGIKKPKCYFKTAG